MAEYRSLDLQALPQRESYALLTAFIQPRPIAFVSTISKSGALNLAPFSFFMAGGSNPPSVCYSPTLGSNAIEKDSLRNVRETREFVVNTVHRSMAKGMNATSANLDPEESEWELAGFSPIPSEIVKPPRVAESLAQMECRLFEILHHGDGPSSARYVVGEVVRFHVREDLWVDDHLDMSKVETIGRLGGATYVDTGSLELFQLDRPR